MEYLQALRKYTVMNVQNISFEEYSEAARRFGITPEQLKSKLDVMGNGSKVDYLAIPIDDVSAFEFVDEYKFKRYYSVTDSTEWRR